MCYKYINNAVQIVTKQNFFAMYSKQRCDSQLKWIISETPNSLSRAANGNKSEYTR